MSSNDETRLLESDSAETVPWKMCCRCCVEKRKIWLFGCGTFFLLFALVLGLVWPVVITNMLHKELMLEKGSLNYKNWVKTPIPLYLEITLFNLENPDDVQKGAKPKVVEKGPYSFVEKHERINIVWNDNDTITFNQIRTWDFDEKRSNGTLDDDITFLNVISATVAFNVRNSNALTKMFANFLLNEEGGTFYVTKKVREVLFDGYQDKLLDFVRKLNKKGLNIPFDKFGWFYDRNNSGTYDGTFTMNTGQDQVSKTGMLTLWNGSNATGIYRDTCGAVKGTTGELWPAEMDPNSPKKMFITDICRYINLEKSEDTSVLGVDGRKWIGGDDILDNGSKYKEMDCFCAGEFCPDLEPGVVNASDCKFGAPVFVSYPHFYLADKSYLNGVEGLNPTKEKHELSMSLEPITGIPLEVNARMQINLHLQKVDHISIYKEVPNVMVPLFWFRQYAKLTPDLADEAKLAILLPHIGVYVAYGLAGLGLIIVLAGVLVVLVK